MKRTLIVEDDTLLNKTLAYNLISDGWEVTPALNAKTAAAVSMLALSCILSAMTGEGWVLLAGVLLTVCALAWLFLLTMFFARRLPRFTSDLCQTMDNMISGGEAPERAADRDTIFARISHRLSQLYRIMQENRRQASEERQELQMLVSDISHQVKTTVSNLKMVTDTLLAKPVTERERRDFLQGVRSQTGKLEFLFQALVKTSPGNGPLPSCPVWTEISPVRLDGRQRKQSLMEQMRAVE